MTCHDTADALGLATIWEPILPTLRDGNFVDPPVGVQSLAQLAGIAGIVSVRELLDLLGDGRSVQKPFYIIGHNTNSIATVDSALQAGVNALELDVTAYESTLNHLCIDHAGLTGNAAGGASAPALEAFLDSLRVVADHNPPVALIVFDCTPPAATPAHGRTLTGAIRSMNEAPRLVQLLDRYHSAFYSFADDSLNRRRDQSDKASESRS